MSYRAVPAPGHRHPLLPIAIFGLAITVGAAIVLALFLRPVDRGSTAILRVFDSTLSEPWCSEGRTVCVTRDSLAAGYALYTPEPHSVFRSEGCLATWQPDFSLEQVGGQGLGAFRSRCSGATFDELGRRLFGPSPRDLDRYRAEGTPESFTIFLTVLEPGPVTR